MGKEAGGELTGLGGLLCLCRTWACTVFRLSGMGLSGGVAEVSGCEVMGEMAGVLCVCWLVLLLVMGVLWCVYVGVVQLCVCVLV